MAMRGFVEMFLQCITMQRAFWLPRFGVEFSNVLVRCLRVEIVGDFGKKIQSKWLIYLLGELRNYKIISIDFFHFWSFINQLN